MTRILVAKDACMGHARCAAAAPELIPLDDNGYVAIEELTLEDTQIDDAQAAVSACPERALRLAADLA